MKIRFYIDKESGLPHIYRHEVREDEVEDVYFEGPVRIVRARKTPELLSDRHGEVDIFALFMFPILSQIVYS